MIQISNEFYVIDKKIVKDALDNKEELFLEACMDNTVAESKSPVKVSISNTEVDVMVPDFGLLMHHVNEKAYSLNTDSIMLSGVDYINNIKIYRIKDGDKECLMLRLFQEERIVPGKLVSFQFNIIFSSLEENEI